MKTPILLSCLTLILLAGCAKDSPQPASAGLDGAVTPRGEYVPFNAKARLVTIGFGSKCAGEAEVTNAIVKGRGQTTPLGSVSITSDHCYFSSRAADPLKVTNGEATFTTTNGDLLYLTYEGVARLNPPGKQIIFDLNFQFDGGTGRFSDAKGSGTIDWTTTFSAWPPPPGAIAQITAEYDGMISY